MPRWGLKLPNMDHTSGEMRPKWRGRLHLGAALLVIPLSVTLMNSTRTLASKISAAVFAAGMLTVFGISSLYHMFARTPRTQMYMKRADHAAIYLLIAATMTPISLFAAPRHIGVPLLVVAWTASGVGMVLKLTGQRDKLASSLYLTIGWTSVIVLPWLWSISPLYAGAVLSAGVIYSAGALMFSKAAPRLYEKTFGYHEFWHAMTIAAAGLNYLAVRGILTRGIQI